MKTSFLTVLFLGGAIILRAAVAPETQDAKPLVSHITDVTVYADRAQVIRAAPVSLATQPERFAFAGLPGWIDEGSVRVSMAPADAGQILDVQIHRTYLSKPADEEVRK